MTSSTTPDMALAIVGVGCLFPEAENLSEYWSNIKKGRDAIRSIPMSHWKPDDYFNSDPKKPDHTYGNRGGFLKPYPFNPIEFGLAPNDIEATDTSQILGMVAAHEALKDAGYGPGKDFDRDRVGCVMGVTGTLELVIPLGARLGHPIWRAALKDAGVPKDIADDVVERISDSYVGWQENSFPGLLGNVVAGRIAQRLNLGGTNTVVDSACASSLSALHLASLELISGRADMVVTGGVDTFNDIFMYMCFSKTPALSPQGNARPFDKNGDGTILGEGVGAVILKRLADAERDGDRIYAVLKSIGTSSDGKGQAIYAPSSKGQAKALRRAYQMAGVTPAQIDLVEGHGTGTKVGDAVELKALTEVYGESGAAEKSVTLGSVKSQIGHTKAAAGVAGLIKVVMSLYHKVLPPTIKIVEPLDIIKSSPFFCSSEARPWIKVNGDKRRAAVSAFGFGGSNFHCVVEEYKTSREQAHGDNETWILPFSAADNKALEAQVNQVLGQATSPQKLRGLAKNLCKEFSATAACRLVVVCDANVTAVKDSLAKALTHLTKNAPLATWSSPEGIYYSSAARAGSLAVLFPGQGSQYLGMLRDLAVSHPAWEQALTAAARTKSPVTNAGIIADRIYPRETVNPANKPTLDAVLRATEVAQPALGAMSAAAWLAVKEFGVKADMVAGHSFGELTALFASGVFDLESFAALAQTRGDVMAALMSANGTADLGAMIAVNAERSAVETILKNSGVDVVIANHNAPKQVVLSGTKIAIDEAAKVFSEAGLASKKLNVSAAFHSALVAPAEAPFAERVQKVKWNKGRSVVYSNTTAKPYPASLADCQKTLSHQLATGVNFVDQIRNMYADGARTFVEVGPGSTLTGLAKSILADKPDAACFAMDSSAGKRDGWNDLARMLAELAALGHAIQLDVWDVNFVAGRDDVAPAPFAIPISGANYRKPRDKKPPVPERMIAPAALPVRVPMAALPIAAAQKTQQVSLAPKEVNQPQLIQTKVPTVIETKLEIKKDVPMQSQTPPYAVPAQAHVSAESLTYVQESILALQRMQQENASLHRQFLENQAASQAMFHRLLSDHQNMIAGQPVITVPVSAVRPTMIAPAAPIAQTYVQPVAQPQAYAPMVARPVAQPVITAAPVATPAYVAPKAVEAPKTTVAPAGSSSSAAGILVSIIAEKTGYPESMLELSMSLEGDLGIDSIKRVEIFAALQDKVPEAASIKPDEMGSLRTLSDIVSRVSSAAVSSAPAASAGSRTGAVAAPTGNITAHLQTLMAIVAEKTGYPVDMLTAEMALEADLGIDSIKRVEIFSSLQERIPQAAKIGHEHMATLSTLAAIADFLSDDAGASDSVANVTVTASAAADADDNTASAVMATIAEKTGYPADMLSLDMELESDLGIDSIKRVEIFAAFQDRWPDQAGADASVLQSLRTLREIVSYFGSDDGAKKKTFGQPVPSPERTPENTIERFEVIPVSLRDLSPQAAIPFESGDAVWLVGEKTKLVKAVAKQLQIRKLSVTHLTLDEALSADKPSELSGVLFFAPEAPDQVAQEDFVLGTFQLLQKCASALQKSGKNGRASVASVTYLGGRFGLDGVQSREQCYGAGVAGLLKTAGHEWPEVNAKAVDIAFESLKSPASVAEHIVSEWSERGHSEVGIAVNGALVGLALKKSAVMSDDISPAPAAGEVWMVSGGARGVTAAVALELAATWKPTLVILGRSELPESDPAWARGANTAQELQKALLASGGQWTPKTAKEAVGKVLNEREIRTNLQAMRDAGATVVYRAVDVRDTAAVGAVAHDIKQKYGPIRGLMHGAGVLTDKWLVEKTLPQFMAVYDTKIRGVEALLSAVDGNELRYCLLFSSSTGRFGRKGQCDYAVSNEILNKMSQYYDRKWPAARFVAVNWGPWDGGMVTPELKKLFASEGIAVIPIADGAHYVLNELSRGSSAAKEVVILGKPEATEGLKLLKKQTVSVEAVPVLKDHVMNGHAVVPAALMMEWIGVAALHGQPGLVLAGMDNFKVLKGIVLKAGDSVTLQAHGSEARMVNGHYEMDVTLSSQSADGKSIKHAAASVTLADDFETAEPAQVSAGKNKYPLSMNTAYETELFHGPMLHGITSVDGMDANHISATVKTATSPATWMHEPSRARWLVDPLVMDCAFQLMILWARQFKNAAALPCAVGHYEQYQAEFPAGVIQVRAEITENGAHKIKATFEFLDFYGAVVARLEGYEGIVDAGLQQSFAKNKITTEARV